MGARKARATEPLTLKTGPIGTLMPSDPEALLKSVVRPGPNFGSPLRDSIE